MEDNNSDNPEYEPPHSHGSYIKKQNMFGARIRPLNTIHPIDPTGITDDEDDDDS